MVSVSCSLCKFTSSTKSWSGIWLIQCHLSYAQLVMRSNFCLSYWLAHWKILTSVSVNWSKSLPCAANRRSCIKLGCYTLLCFVESYVGPDCVETVWANLAKDDAQFNAVLHAWFEITSLQVKPFAVNFPYGHHQILLKSLVAGEAGKQKFLLFFIQVCQPVRVLLFEVREPFARD